MRVGVTGHQDLGSKATVEWVSKVLAAAVKEYEVTQGFTCLAAGTDQIYAAILKKEQIPYIAVIPSNNYEKTFTDSNYYTNYFTLLSLAQKIVKLKFKKPSQKAFFEAGKKVVKLSEILFAVWNGQEARGLGGTADIVKYALVSNKKIIHFNPITEEVIRK
jgi:cobalamin biosynthesis Co2+ chelatase CbiK